MEKVMYVSKDQEVELDNLYCENLIVCGALRVNGMLVAKHIRSTNGYISANGITAKTIVGYRIDACNIEVDKMIAEHVTALEIRATQSMAVSSYISADYVKAGKITLADSDIGNLYSDDVTYLPVKSRSLLGTLFTSFMRSVWFWLIGAGYEFYEDADTDAEEISETAECCDAKEELGLQPNDEIVSEPVDDDLSNDAEFQRIKQSYLLAKDAGFSIQIVPKETQTDATATVIPQFAGSAEKNVA